MIEPGEHRPNPSETPSYKVSELSRMVGLRRSQVDYLTGLGLASPTIVVEGRRSIRNFSQDDVVTFQRAKELLDTGRKPKAIVQQLRPDPENQTLPVLTYAEAEVLRKRYLVKPPMTLEAIGEDFGVSRQAVKDLEKSGSEKAIRRFFLEHDRKLKSDDVEDETENELKAGKMDFGERMYGHVNCPDCGKPSQLNRFEGTLAEPSAIFQCPDGFEFNHDVSKQNQEVPQG